MDRAVACMCARLCPPPLGGRAVGMPAPASGHAIGIDVGGTKIAIGLVSLADGAVLANRRIPTNAADTPEMTLARTVDLAREVAAEAQAAGIGIAALGIGLPELVSIDGEIASGQTLTWSSTMIRAALGSIAPVTVVSDVQAAALAEARFGAGRDSACFVYLSVGTGVSHTLVLGGEPYRGGHGHALLFGCSQLRFTCGTCGSEHTSVLEQRVAGPALARRLCEAGIEVTGGEEALRAASDGNPIAVAIVAAAGEELGTAAGHLLNVLDPLLVVVGGGLGCGVSGPYWDSFVHAARTVAWTSSLAGIPFVRAGLGPSAGMIGAALAAR